MCEMCEAYDLFTRHKTRLILQPDNLSLKFTIVRQECPFWTGMTSGSSWNPDWKTPYGVQKLLHTAVVAWHECELRTALSLEEEEEEEEAGES